MEELYLKLRNLAELTLEELEGMQETLEEKDDELRTKITMVKDGQKKAALQEESTKVQEAMVLADDRIKEIKNRAKSDRQEESGLSAYREDANGESGLSAYREEDAKEESGQSADREETAKQEKEPMKDASDCKKLAKGFLYQYREHLADKLDWWQRNGMLAEFSVLSEEAEKGNGDALVSLADVLFNCVGGAVKSRRLLGRAMAQGIPDAYYRMAYLFSSGIGVEKDHGKAFAYLEKADELGSLPAILLKAECYAGREISYGYVQQIPVLDEKLSGMLRNNLSEMLRNNLSRDMRKAAQYYKRWLENKYGDDKPYGDKLYYHKLYSYVKCGIQAGEEALKDADNLKEILSPLLEHEEASAYKYEARTIYGKALCEEDRFREAVGLWLKGGTRRDIENILEHYDAIVKAGDGDALDAKLAEMTNDTSRDKEKLDIKGMILMWQGDHCRNDDAAAFGYYCKAVGAGYGEAVKKRDEIRDKHLRDGIIDFIVFLEESGEGGNADAYKYLGDMYMMDWSSTPHDYKKALEYYLMGKAGSMRKECEEQAELMKEWLRCEKKFAMAIDCVHSAVSARKKEGLNIIRQLAEKKFPPAVEYRRTMPD